MRFPIAGEPLHTRCVSLELRQAEGQRARLAGTIADQRKAGLIAMAGDFQSAGLIHKMELDGELDLATRVLERVEGRQPVIAYEATPESGGECCRDTVKRIEALVGERFDVGFAKALSRAYGGPRGCSHLLTLFQSAAAMLPRALDFEEQAGFGPDTRYPGERLFYRSLFVDGYRCADDATIQLSIRLADVHTRPHRDLVEHLDRVNRHDEVRIVAEVDFASFTIRSLIAGERRRTRESFDTADWLDRTSDLAGFKGRSLASGMASASFERFGGNDADALMLEAMLHFAPGFIQVIAGIAGDRPAAGSGGLALGRGSGDGHVGGHANSCYMWRTESPLMQIRTEPAAASADAERG